ncbi:hypothetical protein PIB30_073729 [Stylosanthes scabra]|uniref:Uncharacterized protein n=1 Tax=Stylosanthes scabra TaxID=79078 RepID=A0ABU6YNW1_9FABA|nr:hypothetical protein [Stylosanthes scabra]
MSRVSLRKSCYSAPSTSPYCNSVRSRLRRRAAIEGHCYPPSKVDTCCVGCSFCGMRFNAFVLLTQKANNFVEPGSFTTMEGGLQKDFLGFIIITITNWRIFQGFAEFMQKVRLNPNLKKIFHHNHNNNNGSSSMNVASVIRTTLPLPSPSLGNYSFPQEAYFSSPVDSSRRRSSCMEPVDFFNFK